MAEVVVLESGEVAGRNRFSYVQGWVNVGKKDGMGSWFLR